MIRKPLRAFALAAATALTLSFGVGGAAFAENGGATTPSAPPVADNPQGAGNIDVTRQGSIEIHKRLNPESLGTPTGEEDATVTGQKLQGIKFKATKLNLNLDNNEHLRIAAGLTPAEAQNYLTTDVYGGENAVTDAEGYLKLEVPVGVYLVEELPVAEGDVITTEDGKTVEAKNLRQAAPFIVRVPMTNAAGNAWNYNVHVYPKNTTTKVEKTVEDADKNEGDFITYKVKATVPTPTEGYTRTKFTIVDDYDETKLDATSIDLDKVTVSVDGTDLDAADFEVSNDQATGKLTVVLPKATAEGLANNAEVTVSFDIKIKAAGEIVNKANSIVNEKHPDVEEEKITDTPSNEVVTYEAKAQVLKQDNGQGENAKPLSGAKFDLHRCTAPTVDGLGAKISSHETNEDGIFVTKALHVTDLQNSSETISKQYCLVETQAPAGYITPTGNDAITSFTLTREDMKDEKDEYTKLIKVLPAIKNVPSDVPDLPLTGGQGILLLVLGGAAVAGLAVYSARRNSVKE